MKNTSKSRRHKEPSAASLAAIPELDFSTLRRIENPDAGRTFVNVRVLEPDVEAAFPDSEAVNRALRVLMALRDVVQTKPVPAKTPATKRRSTRKRSSRAA